MVGGPVDYRFKGGRGVALAGFEMASWAGDGQCRLPRGSSVIPDLDTTRDVALGVAEVAIVGVRDGLTIAFDESVILWEDVIEGVRHWIGVSDYH